MRLVHEVKRRRHVPKHETWFSMGLDEAEITALSHGIVPESVKDVCQEMLATAQRGWPSVRPDNSPASVAVAPLAIDPIEGSASSAGSEP